MDKWQGLHSFWNSFTWPAYDENVVPKNATLPYITYEGRAGAFEEPVLCSASLWCRSKSWAGISQKEDEIKRYIGLEKKVPLDNHEYLYIYPGTPFSYRMGDADPGIRRIVLNVNVEYFTL